MNVRAWVSVRARARLFVSACECKNVCECVSVFEHNLEISLRYFTSEFSRIKSTSLLHSKTSSTWPTVT